MKSQFLTTERAVIIGSLIISVAILMHGGIIKFSPKVTAQPQTVQPSAAPQVQAPQQPAATLEQVREVFNKSKIKLGDLNRKLVIIEGADPSCPYCHIAAGKNPALNKEAGQRFTLVSDGGTYVAPLVEIKKLVDSGKAAFAWIYTPGHGNGEMGTKSLYCANEKNKFWEVHDLLMSAKGYDLMNNSIKNDKSKSGELAEFLAPVFDSGSMKSCLDSGRYDSRLSEDTGLAQSIGISGTPGFYLNANQFSGAYSFTDMESAVKSALDI